MESENQVLRQQSLVVTSADEDKSKQIERYTLQYAYFTFTFSFPFWAVLMSYEKSSQTKKNDTFRLESKIGTLESEIELLHSNSALAVQAVTPEMNQTTVIKVNFLEENFAKTLLGSINYLISKNICI